MTAYRQSIPAIGLSIERGTAGVPDDGYYYVLFKGDIRGRHRALIRARAQYKDLLAESGWTPPPREQAPVDHGKAAVEAYLDELEDYWTSSHKHARRGGKTMYRS